MDKAQLCAAINAGILTQEDRDALTAAVETHDMVEEARRRIGAFDWTGLLTNILPVILGLFTGGAGTALVPLINLILQIFKLPPLPNPTPTPPVPGGVIPPVPVP